MLLGYLLSAILILFVLNKAKNAVKDLFNVEKLLDSLLDYVNKNEDVQKRIYALGGLIGAGAKQGLGVGAGSGKFKWQDMIGQLIGGWIQTKASQTVGAPPPSTQGQGVPSM